MRLVAAHRSVLKRGNEQKIASNHCFSCHLTSKEAEVNNATHQIEAGIDAEVNKYDVGYRFGYRLYESQAPDQTAYFDPAKHPVLGNNEAEFTSRQAYSDTTLAYSIEPTTEKLSHKFRVKGDVGQVKMAGTLSHTRAENKDTELATRTWLGVLNLAHRLSPNTRLLGKIRGMRTKSDDFYVDVPTYRRGRPGLQVSFDFNRASYLDRAEGEVSAEVIHKLNQRWTISVLGGFQRIDRYNFPTNADNLVTNRMIGQFKARYTKGLKYSARIKYRFEKTSDPLNSARGLFEKNGSVYLDGLPGAPTDLVFTSSVRTSSTRTSRLSRRTTTKSTGNRPGDRYRRPRSMSA